MIEQFINNFQITQGMASSDILNWAWAIVGAILAFVVIDHIQTSMARHSMLKDIEHSVSDLLDSVIAMSSSEGKKLKKVMVRSVLHDDSPWCILKNSDGKIEFKIKNNQRYIHIRKIEDNCKTDEWIPTQALHEMVLLFRRIEKMYKDGIIKRIDLADLFREIIPLGQSGRIQFIREYYGEYDADCIGYIVMQTIVSSYKNHNYNTVRIFKEYYIENKEIHDCFVNSRRIRKIRDYLAVRKFKRIMSPEFDLR